MIKKEIMFLSIAGVEWEQNELISEIFIILKLYDPYQDKKITTSILDTEMTTLMDVLKVYYIDTDSPKTYMVTAIFEDGILVDIMDVDEEISLWG